MNNEQTLSNILLENLWDKYLDKKGEMMRSKPSDESYRSSAKVFLCLNEMLYDECFRRYERNSSTAIKQEYCELLDSLSEDAEKILWRAPKNHTIRREDV